MDLTRGIHRSMETEILLTAWIAGKHLCLKKMKHVNHETRIQP